MSHTLHLIIRCDTGHQDRRCPAYHIGSSDQNVQEVRQAAEAKRWTYKPGQPYHHIGGTDLCPDHSTPAPAADTPPAAARTAE